MPVSEYVGYLLQRMLLLQHTSSKAMAKSVRSLAVDFNTGGAHMMRDDCRKRAGFLKGVIRSTSSKKNFPIDTGRVSIFQIIQQVIAQNPMRLEKLKKL